MGRNNYSYSSILSQATQTPIYRYGDYSKSSAFIRDKLSSVDEDINSRLGDSELSVIQEEYNTSVSTINDTAVPDLPPAVIKYNGYKYINLYSDNIFVDPGVTVSNGTLVKTEDNIKYNSDGSIKPGTYYIQYTAQNANNYKTYLLRTIYVESAPLIYLRGANPYYVENGFDTYVEPGAYTSSGDIGLGGITSTVNNTVNGEYSVTYTATDTNGNTSSRRRTVIVRDTTKPVLSLIGQKIIYLERYTGVYDDSGYGAISDGGEPVISSNNINITKVGIYKIEYVAIDGSGNRGTTTRRIVVRDTTPPVITLNGANTVYVERGINTYTELGATADGNETVTSVITDSNTGDVVTTIDNSVIGEYNVTYRAVDGYGNVGLKVRRVIVRDITGPVITLVGDATVYVDINTGTYTEQGANTDGGESITTEIRDANNTVVTSIPNTPAATFRVIYTASDVYGNSTKSYRNVIVRDGTGPTVTLVGNESVTVELGSTYNEQGANAYDDEDASYLPVTVTGVVDTDEVGVYTVTYTATDSSLNVGTNVRTVTVVDTTGPEISLIGNETVNVERADTGQYTDPFIDYSELNVTVRTVITNENNQVVSSINKNSVGTYKITYIASDTHGNESSITRTVVVRDTIGPEITLAGDVAINIEKGGGYTEPGATADNGEVVTSVIRDANNLIRSTINTNLVQEYTITYTATDSYGNSTDVTRTVNITDSQAPIMTFNPNPIRIVRGSKLNPDVGVTISDGTYQFNSGLLNVFRLGDYEVKYNASDSLGNTAQYTRVVTVHDSFVDGSTTNTSSSSPFVLPDFRSTVA